jgi:anti-anti-sigma factor
MTLTSAARTGICSHLHPGLVPGAAFLAALRALSPFALPACGVRIRAKMDGNMKAQCRILNPFVGWMPVCATAGPVLKIDTEKQATKTIVHCAGKINLESWALFSTTVRALFPESKVIRVDLTDVVQVDSTGIGAFVSVWASAKGSGCDLKFVNPNKHVQDVVEITKLHDMFEHLASSSGS